MYLCKSSYLLRARMLELPCRFLVVMLISCRSSLITSSPRTSSVRLERTMALDTSASSCCTVAPLSATSGPFYSHWHMKNWTAPSVEMHSNTADTFPKWLLWHIACLADYRQTCVCTATHTAVSSYSVLAICYMFSTSKKCCFMSCTNFVFNKMSLR